MIGCKGGSACINTCWAGIEVVVLLVCVAQSNGTRIYELKTPVRNSNSLMIIIIIMLYKVGFAEAKYY